ncbi:AraC family transcriptional regulator [Neolewinella persica]|uniref:AraC family transcriptional regulator n=1 Tax=Neolewinella persica TaxID=70998 RepID=UPI00036B15D4|nr:helix-turn-helix domain-containing protein [Neolewinella persica]
MSLSLADFFIVASIFQGLVIGLMILFKSSYQSKANNYLGVSILLLSFVCFLGWQDFGFFWLDYLWWHLWEFLVPVPLFYYVLHVLEHKYLRAKWLPWLYAPFVVSVLLGIFFDLSFTFKVFELPIAKEGPEYLLYNKLEDSLSFWFNVFLVGWALLLARESKGLSKGKRNWLIRFTAAMLAVLAVWYLAVFVGESYDTDRPEIAIWIALSAFFWWIYYTGVYQLRILDDQAEIQEILKGRKPLSEQADAKEQAEVGYPRELARMMREEEVYRNPDLGRNLIATRLGISEGYLSQIINGKVGESFADYVNGFRIDAAREMLTDPTFDPYSLEAIGLEAGFRSRSVFYSTFKKATGQTPGDYRKAGKTS